MYLAATSAAWRYSGNVTGPDSRLSSPRTSGSPVAFLAVPSAALRSAAEDVDDDLVVADDEALDVVVSLLLLPHPAAVRAPVSARAVSPAAHLELIDMLCTSPLAPRPTAGGRPALLADRGRPRRPGSWTATGRAGRAAHPSCPRAPAGRG